MQASGGQHGAWGPPHQPPPPPPPAQHQPYPQQPPPPQHAHPSSTYYGRGMYSGGWQGNAAPFAGGAFSRQGGHGGPGRGGAYRGFGGIAAAGGHGRGRYNGSAPPGAYGSGYGGGGYNGSGYNSHDGARCYSCGNPGHISRNCPSPNLATNGAARGNGGSRYASRESPRRGGGGGGPPPWVKEEGGWLVPVPGSPLEAERAAAAATAAEGKSRVVWIMRGLPGSGKSTRAAEIVAEAEAAAAKAAAAAAEGALDGSGEAAAEEAAPAAAAIHSTDSFFVDANSGQYVFAPSRLSEHHQSNLAAFEGSLKAGVGCVVVDNTNIQVGGWEVRSWGLRNGN